MLTTDNYRYLICNMIFLKNKITYLLKRVLNRPLYIQLPLLLSPFENCLLPTAYCEKGININKKLSDRALLIPYCLLPIAFCLLGSAWTWRSGTPVRGNPSLLWLGTAQLVKLKQLLQLSTQSAFDNTIKAFNSIKEELNVSAKIKEHFP